MADVLRGAGTAGPEVAAPGIGTEAGRFSAYGVGVGVLAGLIWFSGAGERAAIGLFAAGILGLSFAMPHLGRRLNGTGVDAIYYSAAVLGVLGFYLANEQERELARLGEALSQDRQAAAAAEVRKSALELRGIELAEKAARTSERLQETREALASDEVRALVAKEEAVSQTLEAELGLDAMARLIEWGAGGCTLSTENLARTLAFAKREQERQANDDDGFAIPDRSLDLEIENLERELNRCAVVGAYQSQIASAAPGFARLDVLWRLSGARDLWDALPGLANPVVEPDDELRARLAVALQVDALRTRLAVSERRLEETTEARTATATELREASVQVTDIGGRIEETETAIEEVNDAALSRLASRSKALMEERWPYLLIALLGMKLARKRLI